MNRPKLALIILPILLIGPALWTVQSQDSTKTEKPGTQQEKSSEIKLAVDLVVLDALVMQQKTSRIVGNLKKEDFSLFEDGTKQQISYFSQDRLPLSVILIVDRAGCLEREGGCCVSGPSRRGVEHVFNPRAMSPNISGSSGFSGG